MGFVWASAHLGEGSDTLYRVAHCQARGTEGYSVVVIEG